MEFYFTTLTPLLGYRIKISEFYPTETGTVELVFLQYYSDARFMLDFHKGQEKQVPIKVYATAYDMFISRDDIRAYAMGLFLILKESPETEKPVNFGCVLGLSSDTFIDFAKVGAEFRLNMFDYYSSFPSSFRDFTVYCTVDF